MAFNNTCANTFSQDYKSQCFSRLRKSGGLRGVGKHKNYCSGFLKNHQKFIIGVKLGLHYVKEVLEDEQERPCIGDVLKSKRRDYLHLFYNPEKAAKDQADMNDYLTSLYNDLLENTKKDYRMKDYDKYFEVTTTPKGGRKIKTKEEAMRQASGIMAISPSFPTK